MAKRFRSDAMAAIHEAANDLYSVGGMDRKTMRKFDVLCLTQIQEMTLVFVPKLLAVTLVLIAMGPLLGAQVLRFTQALLLAVPSIH